MTGLSRSKAWFADLPPRDKGLLLMLAIVLLPLAAFAVVVCGILPLLAA